MRAACFVLVACAFTSAGCSALIIGHGVNPSQLTTREEVHAAFGTPITSGEEACESFDEFQTRRKIAEPWKGTYLATGWCITLGFGEFLWFPHESYVAVRRSIVGQKLRFTYDADGKVTSMKRDGEWVPWCGRNGRPETIKR